MDMNEPPAIIEPAPDLNGKPWFMKNMQPTSFVISTGAHQPMVTIHFKDGSMTFGPTYTPDAAARTFWEAISSEYREFLKWKAERR